VWRVPEMPTYFPRPIAWLPHFDAPLMHQVADIISTEFRAKYYATVLPGGSADWYRGLTAWSPNINIFRIRAGVAGRNLREDPYLTALMGVAFVTGLAGQRFRAT